MSIGTGHPYLAGNPGNLTGSNITLKENVNITNLSEPNSSSFDQFNNPNISTPKLVMKDNITIIQQGNRFGFNQDAIP
jgi:hypothetical protein